MNKSKGFVLIAALATIIIAVMLFLGLSTMSRGVRGQLKHFSSRTMNFSIAENVCATIIGEVYNSNWASRPFKNGPVTTNGTIMGGKFESYVEDFNADKKLFDIYVKVETRQTSLMHFWRIQYNDDLLDVSMHLPYVYELFPAEKYPGSGGTGVRNEVAAILEKRKNNDNLATQIANEIAVANKLNDILQTLNLPPSNEDYISNIEKVPGISDIAQVSQAPASVNVPGIPTTGLDSETPASSKDPGIPIVGVEPEAPASANDPGIPTTGLDSNAPADNNNHGGITINAPENSSGGTITIITDDADKVTVNNPDNVNVEIIETGNNTNNP